MEELKILDQLKLGVIELDGQGCVTFANLCARGWFGQELSGASFANLMSAGSRLFFLNHLFPLLHSGQDLEEVYLSLKDDKGQELPVLMNCSRLEEGRKRLLLMPIRRRTIVEQQMLKAREAAEAALSAQQQTLEELREAQSRLALQDRLAVMGTLAAGVAHELNNPLTYVIGNLELLTGTNLTGEEQLSLADIKAGVRRIHGIVNSLKVLSRSEEERKVPLDLNLIGQVACRLGSQECALCCQLECHWYPEPVYVLGDEGRLTQVLLNLLLNACQAFRRADLDSNRIRVRTWMEGPQACLEVSDNGPGIPEEIRDRIFDAFFTTKPVGSGTGLGLSICQGILKALGGSLELRPADSGATFRVTLPASAESARTVEKPDPKSPDRLEGLKCLIIDDDPKVAQVLQRLLSRCHCQLALGGAEGLRVLEQQSDFDMIICDLMMPELSGIQVYRAASALNQKRFVFVTGGVTLEDEIFIQNCGAPLLNKPFGPDKLVAAYAQLVSADRQRA